MQKNTKLKGDLAEAAIIKQCLVKGFKVLKPFGDNYQYDLVIDRGLGFEKIQCKSAVYNKRIGALICSLTRKSYVNKKYINVNYDKTEVDYFALYSVEFDKVYFLKYDENVNNVTLRIDKPKNNQTKGVVFAEQFEF